MDKYQNKYRITSHRKPNWDYSADGLYFLTIVTQNRVCNLGDIVKNEMVLSDYGKIVEREWLKSFDIRRELISHVFQMMPNHLHTIVEIYNANRDNIEIGNDPNGRVETHGRVSLHGHSDPIEPINPIIFPIKRNPPVRLPKSISSFIAGFKSAVNTKIDDYIDKQCNMGRMSNVKKYNKNNHFFQPNYHDHIIRDQFEYQNIFLYIVNNPKYWKTDKFRPTNNPK